MSVTDNPLLRLLRGRAEPRADLSVHLSARAGGDLHEKMRQAYWWIVNNAVICPYYDIEYGGSSKLTNTAGDEIVLHDAMSYSSFVLIPMLTLFTARRALLIGGPGRGKTTSAVLMALIAGMTKDEVRRYIVRGHPQLTVAEMLGAPLPSDMMKAEELGDIKVSWRQWITARVKIIDEYNRIPTKTQSALLSLLGEGYAEQFDQYVHTGRSSWFLTANDDAGGGTFQVIEALRDRIDVIVRAVPFNSGFLSALLQRIESGKSPEDLVPTEIIFTKEELDAVHDAILAIDVPEPVMERLAFFMGQLDYCRMASPQFEYKSKDTLKLASSSVGAVCNEQCPLDKRRHLCTQTENGVSARSFQTAIHYAKAIACFRGNTSVEIEDLRQILPWVLHDKLVPNARSAFFQAESNGALLRDRVSWIRNLVDMSLEQYVRHEPIRKEVKRHRAVLDKGLTDVDAAAIGQRIGQIAALIKKLMGEAELSGPIYEDLIHLKSMYSRYQNQLQWLTRRGAAS